MRTPYPAGLANFTKTLPHNRLGEVDPDAYAPCSAR